MAGQGQEHTLSTAGPLHVTCHKHKDFLAKQVMAGQGHKALPTISCLWLIARTARISRWTTIETGWWPSTVLGWLAPNAKRPDELCFTTSTGILVTCKGHVKEQIVSGAAVRACVAPEPDYPIKRKGSNEEHEAG
eukprot:1161554-Pelagomonas_calceolata.AAC.7